MPTTQTCPKCGAEMIGEALGGLCPNCVGALALATEPVAAATLHVSISLTERPGDRIGRYKLLQQIGEGGCGVVYMAQQEEPVRRQVALKIIKLGMDTRSVIGRFEAERQALAMMDHPNIAKVFDAGATDAGRPFFVMELVRGIKITDYCDQNQLPTRERLDLFVPVCHAIQHAHQKGIIHRDIKPSNILVTLRDGVPVPKVIDFGIAKATTDQLLTDKTVFTEFQQFLGTPAYMSPEQAEMSELGIDTRSDIYSLGILLYELLTGKTPFEAKDLLRAGLEELRRVIREKEPARPSTRLSTMLEGELTTAAKHRHTEAPKLIHLLRGDLDWIVMKALEKDRTRRYETANGLAMDIQRHIGNEPVVARPQSTGYRVQKLIRRNKLAFAAAVAISATLVLGVVVSLWEAIRARRAEREQSRLLQQAEASQKKSKTEAAKATSVSDFLQQMLRSANPDKLKGSDYTVRQMLDDFSAGLDKQLTGQPEIEATMRSTIGNAYSRLGLTDRAEPHLERALALRRHMHGEQSEEFAQSLVDHALNLSEQTRLSEAEASARQALDIYRKCGTDAQTLIHALWVLQGICQAQARFREVETAADEALILARSSMHRDFPEIASLIHAKADVKINQGEFAEAENLALQAVAMHRRLQGHDHPETAWSLFVLGKALRNQHKLVEAERALQESLAIFRRYYSFQHKAVRGPMLELKTVLEGKGDLAGLDGLARQELADANRRIDSNEADAEAWVTRGLDHALHNQWEAANLDCEELITLSKNQNAAQRKGIGIEYPFNLGRSELQLAQALRAAGQCELGEKILREALRVFEQAAGNFPAELPVREQQAFSLRSLADLLNELGRIDEAERENRAAIALYTELKAAAPANAFYCNEEAYTTWMLAIMLEGAGQLDTAEAEYRHTIDLYQKANADFPNQAEFIERIRAIKVQLLELIHRRRKLAEVKSMYPNSGQEEPVRRRVALRVIKIT